jgi:hypothetical protein
MGAIGQSFEADRLDAATLKEAGKLKGWLVMGKAAQAWIRPVLTVVLTSAAIYLNWVLIAKLTEQWPALDKAQQFEMGMQSLCMDNRPSIGCIRLLVCEPWHGQVITP